MDNEKHSPYQNLRRLVKDLENWGKSDEGDDFNPLAGGLKSYQGWVEISEAFLQFLDNKDVSRWSEQECALVENLILLDWATHLLLRKMADSELVAVIQRPYPKTNIRMYMLVKAGLKNNNSIRKSVAHYFYISDEDQAIRLRAFETLALCHWASTDEEAKKLWQSGDTLSRMSVLAALKASKSSLLEQYIQEALASSDEIVKTIANSILYGP